MRQPGPFTHPSLPGSSAIPNARLMHRRHAVNLPPGPGRTRSLQHHCCTCACSTAPARSTRSTTQVARELTDFGLRLLAGWNHWWPYSCWSLRTPSTPQWLQVADRLPRYACRSHAQPSTHVASHTPRHSSSRPWSTSAVLCALTEGDHMISIHHGVHAAMLESFTNEVAGTACRKLP